MPPATRVWLELTCGENLIVVFEQTKDDSESTTTMRVRQTRVTDECELDDPAGCVDVGCVAVRWNLRTREGVLVDLFKAKKGDRIGCDLSSADNPRVKWGQLMLRVVDDVAALLHCRHVFLADESSMRLDTWHERSSDGQTVQVMLKYIRALQHGVPYYERFGYYGVPRELYYGFNGASKRAGAEGGSNDAEEEKWMQAAAAARDAASVDLNAFSLMRTTPFRGGALANALTRHAGQGVSGEASSQRTAATSATSATLIYRFALALGRAQDQCTDHPAGKGDELLQAFREVVQAEGGCEPGAGCSDSPIPNQHWVHSRSAITPDETLAAFTARHSEAIDAEVLAAPHLGALINLLFQRKCRPTERGGLRDDGSRDGSTGLDSETRLEEGTTRDAARRGLKSSALMLALMFDFFAVWRCARSHRSRSRIPTAVLCPAMLAS